MICKAGQNFCYHLLSLPSRPGFVRACGIEVYGPIIEVEQEKKMQTVSIHEARTNLFQLLEQVQQGKPFIIAKAGKPIARVVAIDRPEAIPKKRLGFLAGQIQIPEDFDRMGEKEIFSMFGVTDAPAS